MAKELKKVTNYLRFISSYAAAKFAGRRIPLIVVLCVTNKCNLKCWYCYGGHQHRNNWGDFSTDELLQIVRELKELGTSVLQFQGGEPLLRSDLSVIITEAKRLNMVCDMVTNGTLISNNMETVRLLDKICVSLDGPMNINDKNRGEGVFAKVIEGICTLKSLGLPIRISSVLTSDTTTEDVDWLLTFAGKNKAMVNFSPSFDFAFPLQNNSLGAHSINDEVLRGLFRHILKAKKDGDPVQFSAQSYALAGRWPFEYSKRRIYATENSGYHLPACYHGEYIFFIDADGSMYPCCNFWGKKSINIKQNGLRKSIALLDRHGCRGCYIPAYLDRNFFFDGNICTWFNYFRQGIKGVL